MASGKVVARAAAAKDHRKVEGKRLKAFFARQTSGQYGWIKEFCELTGYERQAVAKWFSGAASPGLDTLRVVAEKLGISRWEIVRAMDGEEPKLVTEERAREIAREIVDQMRGDTA